MRHQMTPPAGHGAGAAPAAEAVPRAGRGAAGQAEGGRDSHQGRAAPPADHTGVSCGVARMAFAATMSFP